jgi:hypothetical protein
MSAFDAVDGSSTGTSAAVRVEAEVDRKRGRQLKSPAQGPGSSQFQVGPI